MVRAVPKHRGANPPHRAWDSGPQQRSRSRTNSHVTEMPEMHGIVLRFMDFQSSTAHSLHHIYCNWLDPHISWWMVIFNLFHQSLWSLVIKILMSFASSGIICWTYIFLLKRLVFYYSQFSFSRNFHNSSNILSYVSTAFWMQLIFPVAIANCCDSKLEAKVHHFFCLSLWHADASQNSWRRGQTLAAFAPINSRAHQSI